MLASQVCNSSCRGVCSKGDGDWLFHSAKPSKHTIAWNAALEGSLKSEVVSMQLVGSILHALAARSLRFPISRDA